MVVLAASIVTKGGKPLLSRQFLGLPRSRLESLLTSFPRLVSPTSEHTVLEAQGVRYLYTPLEDLYVLLITNTQSNILLDLATLALVTRIVTELGSGGRGGTVGENDVSRVGFEILCAWDEVISLGWRENVNLQQVRSVLEMESHEEKIQEIIARNKENEAKEELKRRAKQLEMQRREMTRRGQTPSSTSGGFSTTPSYLNANAYVPPRSASFSQAEADRQTQLPTARPFKTKGMQLGGGTGKGKKNDGLREALGGLSVEDGLERYEEEEAREQQYLVAQQQQQQQQQQQSQYQQQQQQQQQQYSAPPPQQQAPQQHPVTNRAPLSKDVNPFGAVEELDVHLVVRESLSLELNRDGELTSLSLKGDLDLRISNPLKTVVVISLPSPDSYSETIGKNDLQFKTHPNVDKKSWADRGEIRLKEGKKGFPVGQGLGVLKWRMTGKDESVVPISINCWPSTDGGSCTVNLEFELENTSLALHNLFISVPLPPGVTPTLSEYPSVGEYSINPESGALDWSIPECSVESGVTTGTLEFEIEGDDTEGFFPVAVDFVSERTMCGVEVLSVVNPADNSMVEYSIDTLLSADDYVIV